MFFFLCLKSILSCVSHDLCSTPERQKNSITHLEPQNVLLPSRSHDQILPTLCRRYIASKLRIVKYNQYTLCKLKVLAKWLKICRVMIEGVLIFLEGIACKHLLVWVFFVNLSLQEIYIGSVVAHELQVQIKIAIEITFRDHTLISKVK